MKNLWLIAGGNGAGKTTFYYRVLADKGIPFINADEIAKAVYPGTELLNSLNAARLGESIRMAKLRDGVSFCFETVFSHPSKVDFLAHAKSLGYHIHFILIHLQHAELNALRVQQRAEEGGHSVPTDKIFSRIPRTLKLARVAQPLCDEFWVFDNSSLDKPYQKVLIQSGGETKFASGVFPDWARPFAT